MNRSQAALLGLAVLLMTQAFAHGFWFHEDHRSAFWDQERYTLMTHGALDVFDGEQGADQLLHLHPSHPPAHAVISALWALGFGRDYRTLRLLNLALVALGTALVFILGWQLRGPEAALWSALIWAFCPFAFDFSHIYYTEHLLIPVVLLAVIVLQASRDLRRTRMAIVLGLVSGLGLWVRWSFPIYVAVPCILALVRGRRGRNAALVALIALLSALPWYRLHVQDITAFMAHGVAAGDGELNAVRGWAGITFYPFAIVKRILALPLSALVLASSLWLIRRHLRLAGLLILSPVAVIALFSFVLTKGERHILPAIPFLCIAAGAALGALPLRLKHVLGPLLVLHLIAAASWLSFGREGPTPQLRIGGVSLPLLADRAENAPGPPDPRIWPTKELLHSCRGRVLLLFNRLSFAKANFVIASLESGGDPELIELAGNDYGEEALESGSDPNPYRQLLIAETVVLKTGPIWVRYKSGLPIHRNAARIQEALWEPGPLAEAFPKVASAELPDGSTALVLRQGTAPQLPSAVALLALRDHPGLSWAWETLGEARPLPRQRPEKLVLLGIWSEAIAAAERARLDGTLNDELRKAAIRSAPGSEVAWRRFRSGSSPALGGAIDAVLDGWEASRVRPYAAKACLSLAGLFLEGRPGWPLKPHDTKTATLWLRRAYAADRAERPEVAQRLEAFLETAEAEALIHLWNEELRVP